ncbi:hypothetical protein [Bailinhaonella thermotolerans]|uniref:Uncharacterized protein n=1 Tax=Bailinhaonella thermotolerans TaxID=1070861 RepID=A0A3A4AUD1_9ACTN|nr:hypothetical protein [Bailinhaonella thermotolerans]RJL32229.1 hypothetical protein D5H75_17715 [Bailinhaonella thermotolerans]
MAGLPGARWSRLVRRAAALGLALATSTAVALLTTLGSQDSIRFPRPTRIPTIHLSAGYTSHLSCTGSCERWTGVEKIVVTVPAKIPRLAKSLDALLGDDWRPSPSPAQFGEVTTLAYTRQVSLSQPPTPAGLPVTVAHRVPVPPVVEGLRSLGETRLTPAEAALARGRKTAGTGDARRIPFSVLLIPGPGSKVVLRHPRLAVEATTPASTPAEISGGREERVIDVSEPAAYDDHAVSLDVRATSLRQPTVAAILSVRHTVWPWLALLAIAGVVVAAVRRRIDARLDRLAARPDPAAP